MHLLMTHHRIESVRCVKGSTGVLQPQAQPHPHPQTLGRTSPGKFSVSARAGKYTCSLQVGEPKLILKKEHVHLPVGSHCAHTTSL